VVVLLDEGVVEMMVAKGGRRSFSPCSLLEAAGNKKRKKRNEIGRGKGVFI